MSKKLTELERDKIKLARDTAAVLEYLETPLFVEINKIFFADNNLKTPETAGNGGVESVQEL